MMTGRRNFIMNVGLSIGLGLVLGAKVLGKTISKTKISTDKGKIISLVDDKSTWINSSDLKNFNDHYERIEQEAFRNNFGKDW